MDLQKNKNNFQSKKPSREIHIDHQGNEFLENQNSWREEGSEGVMHAWRGAEYEHYAKEKKWYLVAIIILATIIVYALVTNSPIMAITFILIGAVGYIYLEKPPRILDFKITSSGIMVGNELYEYADIKSFWIFYEPPHTKIISLHIDAILTPYIHIPIHSENPVELRKTLLKFIPEEKQEPSMVDNIERFLHI